MSTPSLLVVTYHYVRNLPETPYPRIRGLLTATFARQLDYLQSRYDVVSWEAARAFVAGESRPSRDLCLLTFDDGLVDHHLTVFPMLLERGLSGTFFVSAIQAASSNMRPEKNAIK